MTQRLVLFFLGPRIIDFDTYLPTAVEIGSRYPDARVIIVAFSGTIVETIRTNPTLVLGIQKAGSLLVVGAQGTKSPIKRMWRRAVGMATLLRLIAFAHKPILISSRPFSSFPYSLFYVMARIRRGFSVVLAKTRSPDSVHAIVWQNRAPPEYSSRSVAARLFGRDADLAVDYHDRQHENFDLALSLGTAPNIPRARIGYPHLFPAWRALIDAEIEKARADLSIGARPLFAFLAAKPDSAVNLRDEGSIAFSFKRALVRLLELYPDAVVLLRPHPLAVGSEYVVEALETHRNNVRECRLHPEVMIAMSRRVVVNNPTNVIFSCFPGKFIDVSDYADRHYQERGKVSLANGLGPLHIPPRDSDFDSRFAEALEDDGLFNDGTLTRERDRLISSFPPSIEPFAKAVELT